MKNWNRLPALLLSGAMALSLCACGPAGTENPSAEPSAAASADPDASASPEIVADLSMGPLEFAAGLTADDVLLTVNGEEIPADLMLYWLNYSCYYFMYQYGIYGMSMADYADQLLEDAVSICASEVLLRQRAAQLGCLPTDAQVQAAREDMTADPDTQDLFRTAYGLTDRSIEYLFLSNAYYDNMLEAVTHDPSEAELEDYIAAQGAYRVKHILLKTVDDSRQPLPEEEIARKKAQAEELLAELQGAADLPALFDRRMNELSEDGRDENGVLYAPDGYLALPGQMVSEFENASNALQPGGLSGIVESSYGCHIILRLPLAPLTDEEKAPYQESFRADSLRDQADRWQEEADIVRADVLTGLDVANFYARINAYQQALSAREEGAG